MSRADEIRKLMEARGILVKDEKEERGSDSTRREHANAAKDESGERSEAEERAGEEERDDNEELVESEGRSSVEGPGRSGASAFLEMLSRMNKGRSGSIIDDDDDDDDYDIDDDDDEDAPGMDSNDYHNKAVSFSRRGMFKKAISLCIEGLQHYPNNIDLIADTIKYCSECGDVERAAEYYALLKDTIPYSRWNWRAYTFTFDYLIAADPVKNEEVCRELIANYKKYVPHEEKACMAESELEASVGNTEKSMEVLEKAIRTYPNASQCALKLADMQMERGMYERVVETADYGISAVEVQPSINVPYLLLVRTMAKDALLHRRIGEGILPSKAEVEELKDEYEKLVPEFPVLMRHAGIIDIRKKILKFVKTSD
ncbi:MAG: hypothetical protein K6E50_01265 [Lachnospiraceae bacterium]|nr:hypothetical protein [Lachnospiraceae bacterium]